MKRVAPSWLCSAPPGGHREGQASDPPVAALLWIRRARRGQRDQQAHREPHRVALAGAGQLPEPHGVVPGALADLVVLDAPDGSKAVRQQADRWLVLHGGHPVARSTTMRELLVS